MSEIKYNKDGSVAKKRGRPRKQPLLPDELLKLVEDVSNLLHEEFKLILQEEKDKRKGEWDIKTEDPILFFDSTLSYEITGYKPINKEKGLDFNPDWFTEARETFRRTNHYTEYRPGSKAYADFWTREYIRCRDGLEVNGYTITGDHYFFLNYYLLANLSTSKLGEGRMLDFPNFFVAQYEWFHYLELCKRVRKNAVLMKARGVGFSEMDASLAANTYNCRRNSNTVIAANILKYRDDTLAKTWNALSFINDYTDGGFFKLRQVHDKDDWKRASVYKVINGQKIESGWMSQIRGIVADKPNKIRGDRTDILLYEELGSWKDSMTAFILGDALVGIQGMRFGIKIGGGTGGDTGDALEGLRDMYYNPDTYDILPFRHHYTLTGEEALTAYFIPSFTVVNRPECMDSRGYTDPDKGKAYYDAERERKSSSPKALIKYSAEYCYNAEEAFSLEGDNKFNKVAIAEQLTRIRVLKLTPPIETGKFMFTYKSGERKVHGKHVQDVVWVPGKGNIKILEHPLWVKGPEKDPNGIPIEEAVHITNNLYVAGVDGIDIGLGLTSDTTKDPSDFCIVIKKRVFGLQEPLYVAIYKDRPEDIREAYRNAIALCMYYNCMINIEATRMSFVTWARENYFLNYFMKRPSATYADVTRRKTNLYGTPATVAVIEHQTDLIADYINDYSHNIWFEEMLDEANRYTDEAKRKFDIMAAWGMAELADEELGGVVPKAIKLEEDKFVDFGYYYDERGYKKFGIIPDKSKPKARFDFIDPYEDDTRRIRTSDPRLLYPGLL